MAAIDCLSLRVKKISGNKSEPVESKFQTSLGLDSTLKDETEKKGRVWVFVEAGEPGLSFVSNLVQKDSVPCLLFLAA